MNKTRFIQLIALVLLFTTACKKKDVLPQLTRGKVTVKVNGELKTFTLANSYLNEGVLSFGNDAKKELMGFSIPEVKEGVYDMSHEKIITAIYSKNEVDYGATNGILGIGKKGSFRLHITKIANNKISGTFEMTVLPNSGNGNNITITEGVFEDIPKI
ncbi:DUF6252 family protein [Microscilla marina]|uniref:Lipoprotein, putative n=1 Tax=Microscilla marina ATCC 23134 TaxID=313606 RepID=A1ZZ39_MICM2|nr:DUF6252 family protein [Microscilla marina]EAY24361.1 lipoprotein, putative [Microscilla marina ATCC 23134]